MFNILKNNEMKKVLFFVVSLVIAGTSFFSSVGSKIASKVSNDDDSIEQQLQKALVLEQASSDLNLLAGHTSHSSHSSHSSHRSHSSHYSSR